MNNRGQTTVDLIVVLIVFSAMAGTAFPKMFKHQAKYAVRHAADEFVSLYQTARTVALRSGRVAQVRIDPDNDRFWVEVDTSLARIGITDTIGSVRHLSESKVTLSSTKTLLCFDGRGLATPVWDCPDADATLIFSRSVHADTVRTTLTGKVLR